LPRPLVIPKARGTLIQRVEPMHAWSWLCATQRSRLWVTVSLLVGDNANENLCSRGSKQHAKIDSRREKTMPPAESRLSFSSTTANSIEEGIRSIVRSCVPAPAIESYEDNVAPYDDILAAGASTIEEIDQLVRQLQITRDFLQSEGERVRRFTNRYAHLTRTASASVKIITESLGTWRNPELAALSESKTTEQDEASEMNPIQNDAPEGTPSNTQ
jgi:hypothetical protein